jgi:allantoin racemase
VLDIISNGNFDAYVIACFDDTGLAEARALTKKPVIGIGQASFHLAASSTRTDVSQFVSQLIEIFG